MTRLGFVEQEKARYPVRVLCTALGVSPSGYCAWRSRGPSVRERSDADLAAEIRRSHDRSRGTYGVPRIWADLAEAGHHVSRKRVARLMKRDHLAGVHRRRFIRTTIRDEDAAPFPDLVNRDFTATGPDRLWVADITALPTRSGSCYLAAITDAWSRRVVGWSMATHRSGSAWASPGSRRRWARSATATTTRWPRASSPPCETELIDRSDWANPTEARAAVFEYIEVFYNRIRRHSSLGNLSPEQFEERYRSSPAAKAV